MNAQRIYQVFENAFTGHFVDFEKNPGVHIQRWLSMGVDFALSYGVKSDGKLVAFILHAPREDFVFNLATGVMKEYQGQGLTGPMYERIKRELPAKGFARTQLEVIIANHQAIRAYEKSGMKTRRKLLSWKGELKKLTDFPGTHEIKKVSFGDEHATLTPYPYAFEQGNPIVLKRSGMLELHELRRDGKLFAFAIWNPWQMNLVQLGGKNSEALEGLLFKMKLIGEHAGMINVDEKNELVNDTLKKAGLVNYLSQFEMEMCF